MPLFAKRPTPSRLGRASRNFHPRNLSSEIPRPEALLLRQPRRAQLARPAEFLQLRLPRNRPLAFRIARTRWYPRTPRHRQSPNLLPTFDPPPAIAGTRYALQAQNPRSLS